MADMLYYCPIHSRARCGQKWLEISEMGHRLIIGSCEFVEVKCDLCVGEYRPVDKMMSQQHLTRRITLVKNSHLN